MRPLRGTIKAGPPAGPSPDCRWNFTRRATLVPQVSKFYPLGKWDMSFVGRWRAGQYSNWYGPEGGDIPGLIRNVQYKSIRNMDLRLTKQFAMMGVRAMFFLDVDNVFNLKRLNSSSANPGLEDWEFYMVSLHLPEDTFGEFEPPYPFIPGNDSPGSFRDYDTGVCAH